VWQIQVAADVGERFGQGLGAASPHVLQALADALQNAGFLGFFLLAEQTHGGSDDLVRGGEASASHLGLDELLKICGQVSVHLWHLLPFYLTTVGRLCRAAHLDACPQLLPDVYDVMLACKYESGNRDAISIDGNLLSRLLGKLIASRFPVPKLIAGRSGATAGSVEPVNWTIWQQNGNSTAKATAARLQCGQVQDRRK
jgi:hypothetical protein